MVHISTIFDSFLFCLNNSIKAFALTVKNIRRSACKCETIKKKINYDFIGLFFRELTLLYIIMLKYIIIFAFFFFSLNVLYHAQAHVYVWDLRDIPTYINS